MTKDNSEQTNQAAPATGFAIGELVSLRPVLEADLPALAALLAANPGEPERLPWTTQRLKKKFEDEKEPGLWGEKLRVFSIVRLQDGAVAGYVKERRDDNAGVYWCHLHVEDGAADRAGLFKDALAAYLAYSMQWQNPLRVSVEILGCEADKAGWLADGGFPLELRRERMVLWLGEAQAICTHTWYSARLQAELARREAAEGA